MAKDDKTKKEDRELTKVDKEMQHELKYTKKYQKEADQILSDDPLAYLLAEVSKEFIGDVPNVEMCIYSLVSLNPYVENILHLQHVGGAQSGKSQLGNTCEKLLKVGMRFPIKHMSPKYIFYASKTNSVKDTLITFDDASEGDISILKALADNSGAATHGTVGNSEKLDLILDAEPLVWFSTVSPLTDEGGQVSSRYILLNINESPTHHSKVLDSMRERVSLDTTTVPTPISYVSRFVIASCIQNTDFKRIAVPHFEFPKGNVTKFRDGKGYISLVQSIAVLNHRNRVIRKKDKALLATQEDIDAAAALWNKLAPYNDTKLSEPQLNTLSEIRKFYSEILEGLIADTALGITKMQMMERTQISEATFYRHIKVLLERGYIGSHTDGRKDATVYFPLSD